MGQWRDDTRYSKGERREVAPRTWILNAGAMRIVITRTRLYAAPDDWHVTVRGGLVLGPHLLEATELEGAKREGVLLVRDRAAGLLHDAAEALNATAEETS